MRTSSSSTNEEAYKLIPSSAVAGTLKCQFRAACQLTLNMFAVALQID
jgi:hypothetical protein